MSRPPRLLHCTSEPLHFFGRAAELALLDAALDVTGPSVVALVGPGGQGKTAIVRHWLERFTRGTGGPPVSGRRTDLQSVPLAAPAARAFEPHPSEEQEDGLQIRPTGQTQAGRLCPGASSACAHPRQG